MLKGNFHTRIFALVLGASLLFAFATIAFLYQTEIKQLEMERKAHVAGLKEAYKNQIKNDSDLMSGLVDFISGNEAILAAWKNEDRDSLFKLSRPIFERLHKQFNVTHFYFTFPSRVNFLRVHKPGKHSDVITRITTVKAKNNLQTSSGVELGVYGSLTLRVVKPVYDQGVLLGFIELGEEIDEVFVKISRAAQADIMVLINKRYLERNKWEEGIDFVSKIGTWGDHADYVIASSTIDNLRSTRLLSMLGNLSRKKISVKEESYVITNNDLKDVTGRSIGKMVLFNDIGEQNQYIYKKIQLFSFISLLILSIIAFFFKRYLKNVQDKIEQESRRLASEIEKRKETEQNLVLAKDQAEKENQAKSDFLSRMSHELRTPLNAIMGFSQLLNGDYEKTLSEQDKECVTEIIHAGEHLLNLINEVLDLSRIEAGKLEMSMEPVELGVVMDECLALLEPLAAERGIHIRFNKQDDYCWVRADKTRFKQSMINLVSNAIKYNRDDGEVIIGCSPIEGRVRISVTDTGVGIPENKRNLLFKPFERIGNREQEGTGIGLALTQSLVEMMDGRIGFESSYGNGSTFWIELNPAQDPFLGMNEDEHASTKENDFSSIRLRPKILYIEDNPANIRLIQGVIRKKHNADLFTSHSGELGWELIKNHLPDVILLDINLPGVDGYEILRRIKEYELTAQTPVFAISANAMKADINKGLKAGFNEYFAKPVDLDEFSNKLEEYLTNLPSGRGNKGIGLHIVK